jgi:manganese transport system membrane protein mntB
MLGVSVGVSLAGTLTGLYASYYLDVSPGGAVVVTQGLLFAIAYALAPRYGLVARLRARRQVAEA